jgi:mRNA interferase RelE/StbE
MFTIEFSKQSNKFFQKLQKQDQLIIAKKINQLKENPFRFLKGLQGDKLWRLRIMKFRLLIDVIVARNKIIILRMGYRKNIYNN